MAEINNVQAVKFCNEKVRTAADRFAQLYWWAKIVSEEWVSQGIGSMFPNDDSVVMDGSAIDGRTILTGADVHILAGNVVAFIADLEANGNLKLNQISKVAVNAER